jgi:hypothetical protein
VRFQDTPDEVFAEVQEMTDGLNSSVRQQQLFNSSSQQQQLSTAAGQRGKKELAASLLSGACSSHCAPTAPCPLLKTVIIIITV